MDSVSNVAKPNRWTTPQILTVGDLPFPRWVVTASDARFWPWLASFVGSLRDIARYSGAIAVLDYGLEPQQVAVLENLGIERVPAANRHRRVLDRYFTLSERFPPSAAALVAHFDADVWFNGSIDSLFGLPQLRAGRLGATIDVLTCDYYFRCSSPERHDEVRRLLNEVQEAFGESLQAGVVVGSSTAWSEYTRSIAELLDSGFAKDGWGTDALALNLFARDRPDDFTLLPITYNAPPLWDFERVGDCLFAMEPGGSRSSHRQHQRVPIHAVHRTSGVRGIPGRDLPVSELHPRLVERWARRFGLDRLP